MAAKNPQENLVASVKLLTPIKPGDIVFLECARPMTENQMAHLNAYWKRTVPELKVVILQDGVRLASQPTGVGKIESSHQ